MKRGNKEDHPLYHTWKNMRRRCNSESVPAYKYYGGRGITVCPSWDNIGDGFWNFVSDMGERPQGYSLDRIDNDKGYYKENCRWATGREQALNRSDNVYITYLGETLTESEFSEKYGLARTCVQARRNRGLSPEEVRFGRDRRPYEVDGKKYNQKDLAGYLGVSPQLLNIRLKRGFTVEELLSEFGRV